MPTKTMRLAMAVAFALQFASFAPAIAADDAVNILQYALAHPTDNARLPTLPALGDSVPSSVKLEQPKGSRAFAYFYYAGQPIIVEMKTRSIVRIGG
ncbi:hypothetical protein [Jiella pacifica]|uniref:DUF1236 domain-containing protein n=1 Tax=Jiella pacifica TaxID=2696469 RepID=A0A6N9T3H5_9HYPH|nr:hypothetical protein [Jiella pacifica]NDW04596.1 hypothetical protein [Jiella pacifica]